MTLPFAVILNRLDTDLRVLLLAMGFGIGWGNLLGFRDWKRKKYGNQKIFPVPRSAGSKEKVLADGKNGLSHPAEEPGFQESFREASAD